jgi:hypothetical protein
MYSQSLSLYGKRFISSSRVVDEVIVVPNNYTLNTDNSIIKIDKSLSSVGIQGCYNILDKTLNGSPFTPGYTQVQCERVLADYVEK